ncbi:hypothetical protein SAMD00019534_022710 [Acytostelium subglobosum LB1]|uniref:hypothetical protein n=1 Tax=Acytostelium subglobosum LB1 TaxID=1410327 RepID=UPI000645140B|nr:hypothetical protein SAMD00019534_022710 [Acytostelium subglobosum LB1]GAM19096.1 hypothetical protein SAMD00019534_022710 [Acytostelium subglobosum LB1]|eukprot:XP_012757023.1 hypothetical protein SAMD00019534_022710 [Acytostelium subglobosum LB1]
MAEIQNTSTSSSDSSTSSTTSSTSTPSTLVDTTSSITTETESTESSPSSTTTSTSSTSSAPSASETISTTTTTSPSSNPSTFNLRLGEGAFSPNFKMPDQRPKFTLNEEILGEDTMTPKQIVAELDKYIIGQGEAKRAVSIALRNRWRRKRLDSSIMQDVYPKNILMIGPTGVGKTEIARRLANIVKAPFIKVEATKYTEVGFHGPDVDSIIRDLVEVSINNIKSKIAASYKDQIDREIEQEVISSLVGPHFQNRTYDDLIKLYREKALENIQIELDLPPVATQESKQEDDIIPLAKLFNIQIDTGKTKKKSLTTVAEARTILEKSHKEKYIVQQDVTKLAIQSAEQNGIVFLDEIDKICTPKEGIHGRTGDASTDGVQRDLLPIIEGCNVHTKYGIVDTSRILFIASGAFHANKPSDLISELQGRLPIRVELKPLEQSDFYRILTEPTNNQIKQQEALLKTEGIQLQFSDDALKEISRIAYDANAQVQNIGARRLHGIIEKVVEDLSYNCDLHVGGTVVVGVEDVRKHLSDLLFKTDLSKYII